MLQPHVFAGREGQGQLLALSEPDDSEGGPARGHRASGRPQSWGQQRLLRSHRSSRAVQEAAHALGMTLPELGSAGASPHPLARVPTWSPRCPAGPVS